MRKIGLKKAKSTLSSLLDRVADGEAFVITLHGKAVARLMPVHPAFDRAKAKQAANALLQARKGVTLGTVSIKELVDDGRR